MGGIINYDLAKKLGKSLKSGLLRNRAYGEAFEAYR
jgi:hypothetical protein